MRFKEVGNKRDTIAMVVRNDESSSSIPRGAPVCLTMDGTDDGLAVVLPASGAAIKAHSLAFGVALDTIVAGAFGEVQNFGVCDYVKATINTRAATTDSWTSRAAVAVGQLLVVDTVNNAFATAASVAATSYLPVAVVGSAVASQAASASTTANDATVVTTSIKAFLRML